jgi:hypothetical protein
MIAFAKRQRYHDQQLYEGEAVLIPRFLYPAREPLKHLFSSYRRADGPRRRVHLFQPPDIFSTFSRGSLAVVSHRGAALCGQPISALLGVL